MPVICEFENGLVYKTGSGSNILGCDAHSIWQTYFALIHCYERQKYIGNVVSFNGAGSKARITSER